MDVKTQGRRTLRDGRPKQGPRREGKLPTSGRSNATVPEKERLRIQAAFFRNTLIDVREFLHAFEHFPGLSYFIKDAESRIMLENRDYTRRVGAESQQGNFGKKPHEYVAQEVADHYLQDDQKVLRTGQPLRNIVEIGFNERGVPEWFITSKFPLTDVNGRVIGLIGTIQVLKGRLSTFPHFGDVGRATDYIGQHLGDALRLESVATHVGLSKRHLQRLFHKSVRMTVQQFIIQSRIHAAAHELISSDRPIAEIALMFGFSDQSAFSNAFRRVVAMAPSEYRKRFLSEVIA